jgi:hypothetical protein
MRDGQPAYGHIRHNTRGLYCAANEGFLPVRARFEVSSFCLGVKGAFESYKNVDKGFTVFGYVLLSQAAIHSQNKTRGT